VRARVVAWGLVAVAGCLLGTETPGAPVLSPSVSLSMNRATLKPSDTSTVTVGVTNPVSPITVDVYFGALLPDGVTLVDFVDLQFDLAIVPLSQVAALRPIVAGVTLPSGFTFNNASFFSHTWSGMEPQGRYLFFLALAPAGGPVPASFLALSTAELTVESSASGARSDLHFNGLSDFAAVASSPDLSVSPAGLTVAAWVRPDTLTFPKTEGSLPTEQYVHWLGKGETGQHEWVFRMYSDPADPRANRISFYVFNANGGRGCGSYFQDPLQAGQWIDVVGVADTATQQVMIYKNGALRATTSFAGLITPTPGSAPLRMGTRDFSSFLQGAIGPVRVWNRPLTASEVHDLYAATAVPPNGLVAEYLLSEGAGLTAHDTSGHAHHGSLFGATLGTDPAPVVNTTTGSSGGGC
jgi:Concanavalin A-like lectin/glucanases superfamily